MPEETFADWLVRERVKRGWSQEQLAEKIGFSQAAVSRVESGETPATAKFANALAEAFDMGPTIVYSAAGLLPPVSEEDEWAARIYRRLERMPPQYRDIAETLIDALYQKEQSEKKEKNKRV